MGERKNIMTPEQECYNLLFADRSFPLHAMLINAGRELVVSTAYRWDGMRRGSREFVIWQYTEAGEGALDLDGETIRQRSGCAMLLIVPEPHCYYLPADSPFWRVRFLTMYGAEVVRLARECRRRCGPVMVFSPDDPVPAAAQDIFLRCRAGTLTDAYLASSLTYDFMTRLLAASGADDRSGEHAAFVRRVNDYCLARLDRPVRVEDLARRAGYSRWHFARLFRERFGQSPRDYVLELKMRLAVRLLQTTPKTVKEIAAACGFDDPAYFCRVFRHFQQTSPAAFRTGKKKKAGGIALETQQQ